MTNFATFAEAYFAAPAAPQKAHESLANAVSRLAQKVMQAAGQSPYALLGVPHDADAATLRRAYMAKVQTLHPDRFRALGADERTLALLNDQLATVNAAYRAVTAQKKDSVWKRFSAAKTPRSAKAAA